ncbi:MAG: hypothetical protein AMXMBFR4_01190 [Candidatus Hydrogenedentota bacterium]
MFKLYSKGCEYALRALSFAAMTNGEGRFKTREICEWTGIPESYARKMFLALVHRGLLRAIRGPGGGYALTRSPGRITLLDIIQAVDGKDTFDHCVMGLQICDSADPCPLHETWARAKERLLAQLRRRTLEDLLTASAGAMCRLVSTSAGKDRRRSCSGVWGGGASSERSSNEGDERNRPGGKKRG